MHGNAKLAVTLASLSLCIWCFLRSHQLRKHLWATLRLRECAICRYSKHEFDPCPECGSTRRRSLLRLRRDYTRRRVRYCTGAWLCVLILAWSVVSSLPLVRMTPTWALLLSRTIWLRESSSIATELRNRMGESNTPSRDRERILSSWMEDTSCERWIAIRDAVGTDGVLGVTIRDRYAPDAPPGVYHLEFTGQTWNTVSWRTSRNPWGTRLETVGVVPVGGSDATIVLTFVPDGDPAGAWSATLRRQLQRLEHGANVAADGDAALGSTLATNFTATIQYGRLDGGPFGPNTPYLVLQSQGFQADACTAIGLTITCETMSVLDEPVRVVVPVGIGTREFERIIMLTERTASLLRVSGRATFRLLGDPTVASWDSAAKSYWSGSVSVSVPIGVIRR